MARQDWPDGSVYYQVEVDFHGRQSVTASLYRWPQPGLRLMHGSTAAPSKGTDESQQGGMPQRGPVSA
ncbi:hypothetical protein ABT039_18120 [Streptomyces lasiicapitis]|uniref:hypothetical protein n=1 Tax=Streptomyces lasiicapitis TaxID=1923961 RepID=UPI0033242992